MELEKVVARVLSIETDQLNDSSNAKNTRNWDSMRHIELLLAVETAFKVDFTMAEITSMQNLGDMRRLLAEKVSKAAANPATEAARVPARSA